jgi:plastocyanin
MDGGAAFSRTVAEPGDYPCFCLNHPEMTGTVRVREAPR